MRQAARESSQLAVRASWIQLKWREVDRHGRVEVDLPES